MERPWTYYLLLVVAWLAALWGLWQIGDAWVTWPAIDSAAARDVARAKLWLAGALILGGMTLGGLATLIRLVQDGFAQLAARPAMPAPAPGPVREPRPGVKPEVDPEVKPAVRPEPKVEARVEAKPEPPREAPPRQPPAEPTLAPQREPRLEPAVRLSGEAGPGPREPRLDRPRGGEDTSTRREPKLLRDS